MMTKKSLVLICITAVLTCAFAQPLGEYDNLYKLNEDLEHYGVENKNDSIAEAEEIEEDIEEVPDDESEDEDIIEEEEIDEDVEEVPDDESEDEDIIEEEDEEEVPVDESEDEDAIEEEGEEEVEEEDGEGEHFDEVWDKHSKRPRYPLEDLLRYYKHLNSLFQIKN